MKKYIVEIKKGVWVSENGDETPDKRDAKKFGDIQKAMCTAFCMSTNPTITEIK